MKKIKDVVKSIASLVYGIPFKIVSCKGAIKLLERICVAFNRNTRYFANFTIYPKEASDVTSPLPVQTDDYKMAIIMQGEVCTEDNFTVETVKLYRRMYPSCMVIVSTWNTINRACKDELEREGAVVVLSEYPEFTGIGNINYQVTNTLAGIMYAKGLGIEYVIKTRADQRFYRKHLTEYLMQLQDLFPLVPTIKGLVQYKRIVLLQGLTIASPMLVPGFISDFFYFGQVDDMIHFFSCPLQDVSQTREQRRKWLKELRQKGTLAEYFRESAPEVMLYHSYMERNGVENDNELETYWEFLKNYTIGISWYDIGLYWNKYDSLLQTNKLFGHYVEDDSQERMATYGMDFVNWLLIANDVFDVSSLKNYAENDAKIIG